VIRAIQSRSPVCNGDSDAEHEGGEILEGFPPYSLCEERMLHALTRLPASGGTLKYVRLKTTEAALLGRHWENVAEDFNDPQVMVGYAAGSRITISHDLSMCSLAFQK